MTIISKKKLPRYRGANAEEFVKNSQVQLPVKIDRVLKPKNTEIRVRLFFTYKNVKKIGTNRKREFAGDVTHSVHARSSAHLSMRVKSFDTRFNIAENFRNYVD